ncbi:MAG: hypothetical protein BGO93_16005 [Mesorhizobium sp. 65-26]|nr:MAG: hypothetical protein BGO93_16005 [Mesorhizobium sp. 65-26]
MDGPEAIAPVIAWGAPLSVRFADTSPPFHGGEETPIAKVAAFISLGSSPPQSGGEVSAQRTERGTATC